MTTGTRQSTLRPPPSSPSLAALLEVELPSPILSPSDLSPSHTSGEIPILLFDSSHATAALPEERDQSLFSTPISYPRTCKLSSKPNWHVAGFEPDEFSTSTAINLEHMVKTNLTSDTFGRHTPDSEENRLLLCWSSSLSVGDFTRDSLSAAEQSPNMTEHDIEHYNDSWLATRNWKPSGTEFSWKSRGEKRPTLRLEHRLHSDTDETLYIQDSRFANAPLEDYSLVMYASSPASSSSLNHHKQGYSVSATREHHISRFGSSEITLIDPCVREASDTQEIAASGSVSSLSRRPAIHIACHSLTPRREFHASAPRSSGSKSQIIPGNQDAGRNSRGSTNDGSAETHVSSPGEKYSSSFSSYIPHHLGFPLLRSPQSRPTKTSTASQSSPRCNYQWLQNVTLGLVIDQEGFRSIEPTFEKTGIRRIHLESGNKGLDVAVFMPMTKQAYRFHYAPFEGLPILRRLTINGDESRDFLSRQAYLGLKSNGVYIVHGTEVASPTAVSSGSSFSVDDAPEIAHASARTQEQSKLYWWFEYSIEDRKADQPGRSLDGERVLIPLTFTCSPRLIHPSQGKKIKLMHIVRKSVTPKLVAERKQQSCHHSETRAPLLPPLRTPFTSKMSPENQFLPLPFAQRQAWNLHRRSHSNPREHRLPDVRAKISQDNDFKNDPSHSLGIDSNSKSTHRRRASSAEAHHRLRHIIPPSRLRQLLEEGRSEHDAQGNGSFNKPISSPPSDFFPLKPSPHFKAHQ